MRASGLRVGDSVSRVVVEELTRTQIVMFAGATGDFNPMHSDEVWTTQVGGYDSILAHGTLTMGLTASAVTRWIDEAEVTRFGVRFARQVWPGDSLTVTATVTSVTTDQAELELLTVNQDGDKIISGYATVRDLP